MKFSYLLAVLVMGFGISSARADDTADLQKLLDVGGKVTLPAGKIYQIAAPLKVHSNTTIASDGTATIKAAANFSGNYMLILGNATNITLSKIKFDGAQLKTVIYGILGQKNTNLNIADSDFKNFTTLNGAAVMTVNTDNFTIARNTFSNSYIGMIVSQECSGGTIQRNRLSALNQYGITVQGTQTAACNGLVIDQNTLYDIHRTFPGQTAGHHIYINIGEGTTNKHHNITVSNNIMTGLNLDFASGGNADLVEYNDVDGGKVFGNSAQDGGDVGIAIDRSVNIEVNNNSTSRNNTNGIVLWDSNNSVVHDNVVFNNNQDRNHLWGPTIFKGGIRIMTYKGQAANNTIQNNTIYDDQASKTQDYGIYVMSGAKNNVIGCNNIYSNARGTVLNEGQGTKTTCAK